MHPQKAAETVGYSRQRANLQKKQPIT